MWVSALVIRVSFEVHKLSNAIIGGVMFHRSVGYEYPPALVDAPRAFVCVKCCKRSMHPRHTYNRDNNKLPNKFQSNHTPPLSSCTRNMLV